jgi:AcrR family transcriptional regulator
MAVRGRPRKFDREDVLERAMHVFWAKGYEGAALSDLTSAMGLTPPSLYAAFGDKDGLFREAVERYKNTYGVKMLTPLMDARPVRAAFADFLQEAALIFAGPGSPGGCMFSLSVVNCTPEHADLKGELADVRHFVRQAIIDRLIRAVSDGEFKAGTNIDPLAEFYGALMQGYALRSRDGATSDQLIATIPLAMLALDAVAT